MSASKASVRIQNAEMRREAAREAAAASLKTLAASLSRGETLAGAAPLVFQGMCRREGIRVLFTESPKTDGRTIWLGSIDLTNPLAATFVYGHGCHERHHVVYTDFSVIEREPSGPVRELTNVFEDIRVDRLGQEDYAGYLLWRNALFKAYESIGSAPWQKPEKLTPPRLLLTALLLREEVKKLGLTMLEGASRRLVAELEKAFGEETSDAIFRLIDERGVLQSTADAHRLAQDVMALLKRQGEKAAALLTVCNEGDEAFARIEPPLPAFTGQGALFDAGGDVTPEGRPKLVRPGLEKALREAENFGSLECTPLWLAFTSPETQLSSMMVSSLSAGADLQAKNSPEGFAVPQDYIGYTKESARDARNRFRKAWKKSASLREVFVTALRHPLAAPAGRTAVGFDLDDTALAGLLTGNDAVFMRHIPQRGRDVAVEILIDSSGSMEGEAMAAAKAAGLRLLEALRFTPGFRAAAALFPGATMKGVTPIADWHATVKDAIRRTDYVSGYGGTPIQQALFWGGAELDARSETKKAVFVVTDGRFAESVVTDVMAALRERGIAVVMIGIGDYSTPVGDITVKVEKIEALPQAMAKALRELTRRFRIGTGGTSF